MTVCVSPALASDIDAVLYHNGSYGYLARTTSYPNGELSEPIAEPFNHISATLRYASDNLTDYMGQKVLWLFGDTIAVENTDQSLVAVYPNDVYFEVIFPVGSGNLNISWANVMTYPPVLMPPAICGHSSDVVFQPGYAIPGVTFELLVDDVVIASETSSQGQISWPDSFNYSGSVNRRFSLRYSVHNSTSAMHVTLMPDTGSYAAYLLLPYDLFTFEGEQLPVDDFEVVISKLDEITGKLDTIESHTVSIDNNLSEIKNGLQDSNSSIWGAFKDSVSSIFVPSSSDLESVKDGFDQLAEEKLGGAYQTVDMVSGGVQSVTDKFKSPGSYPGVEFPGISVPLGGDVGTVTLAASQTVTIPERITDVLYPVLGVIIPIVCTIWTVRLGLDMVNCFMSGMSYGEFLHRHTDKGDDEV